jgi:hypothetical protein
MSDIKINEISYGGWKHCIQVTNNVADLVITGDVGPRIIRFGFLRQENEMCEIPAQMGLTGGDEWRMYGGHRLWHSPESKTSTYEPDNKPVKWEDIPDGIKTVQDIEPNTKIKKEMEITLFQGTGRARIIHRLTNTGVQPIELSAWGISAMAPGGKEIIPLSRKDTGLLPNRVMVLWPYTNLRDARLYLGEKYVILQQNTDVKQPLKIGILNEDGWAAYFNHGHLFLKYYKHVAGAGYPDFNVSYETYTNDLMLEMETLSPLTLLQPGEHVEHEDTWELFDNVPMPSNDEMEIEKIIESYKKQE